MPRILFFLFFLALTTPPSSAAPPPLPGSGRKVVLVVWDGMRPDFISERDTPRLAQLAREGVRFSRHHSVFPTSTEVNGAALATGAYPSHNGLLANREYRPAIEATRALDTGEPESIQRGDELTGGHYLGLPTIAETARAAGLRTALAGSKSVVFLHDRHAEWTVARTPKTAFTIFAAAPMGKLLADEMQKVAGRFLNAPDDKHADRNRYTTRAVTDFLWRDAVPAFTLLWLSEPDLSQHETSPGSAVALAAMQNCDRCLGAVLDSLVAKNVRAETDVMVVSDHGFSTIERAVDVPAQLNAAGFTAATQFPVPPKRGDIMIVGNGGTMLFYVTGHAPEVTKRLVEWLQHSDFAGVLFSRDQFEGTFDLSRAHLELPTAPDVVMAFRWDDGKNSAGVPGRIVADAGRVVGKGSHASLSPFDVHNVFVAAGPDFRRGFTDENPTANTDIAPTIFRILGLTSRSTFDGRAVDEAMTGGRSVPLPASTTETATRQFADGQWQQNLRFSQSAEAVYLDEGNGSFVPK